MLSIIRKLADPPHPQHKVWAKALVGADLRQGPAVRGLEVDGNPVGKLDCALHAIARGAGKHLHVKKSVEPMPASEHLGRGQHPLHGLVGPPMHA